MSICSSCGNAVRESASFCGSCGAPVLAPAENTQPVTSNPPVGISDNIPPVAPEPVVYTSAPQQSYTPAAPQNYAPPQNPAVYAGAPNQGYPVGQPYKPKKKGKGCLIGIIAFLVVIGLIIGSLFIFLPGLFGPRNLGIKTTREAQESLMQKIDYARDETPTGESIHDYTYVYGPTKHVDTVLSSEEITSFMNIDRPDYYAVRNVQVRINDDGTIEASGTINVEYVLSQILGDEYSMDDLDEVGPMAGLIPDNINIYVKADGEIYNNSAVGVDISSVKVMGINVLDNVDLDDMNALITEMINATLESHMQSSGSFFESIRIENGQLVVSGEIPSYLERLEN